MGHLRRGLGLAAGDDDPRAGPRRPRAPRGRDGDPRVLQLRAASTPTRRRCSAASTSTPTDKPGADAEISWWVVDECVGTDLERALDELVPALDRAEWPLERPRYVGRDLTWAEWLAIPRERRPAENQRRVNAGSRAERGLDDAPGDVLGSLVVDRHDADRSVPDSDQASLVKPSIRPGCPTAVPQVTSQWMRPSP